MSTRNRGTDVPVILGIVLVIVGVMALLAPLLGPLQAVMWFLARIGWPIILIIVGLLFILRARGRGWNTGGRPFLRSRTDRMLGGVLGGAAGYLGVSSTLLRVAYALLTLFTGLWPGLVAYLVALLVIPEEQSADYSPPPAPAAPAPPAPPVPPASPSAPAAAPPAPAPPAPAPPVPAAPVPPASEAPSDTPAPQAPPVPPAPPSESAS